MMHAQLHDKEAGGSTTALRRKLPILMRLRLINLMIIPILSYLNGPYSQQQTTEHSSIYWKYPETLKSVTMLIRPIGTKGTN